MPLFTQCDLIFVEAGQRICYVAPTPVAICNRKLDRHPDTDYCVQRADWLNRSEPGASQFVAVNLNGRPRIVRRDQLQTLEKSPCEISSLNPKEVIRPVRERVPASSLF